MIDNDMFVMNDGSHTRINTRSRQTEPPRSQPPSSEGKSAPDVSMCGATWSARYSWNTVDGIGSSDHTPICITLHTQVNHNPVTKGQVTWRTSGADWNAFSDAVERDVAIRMRAPCTAANIHEMVKVFNDILICAAKKHIGTNKPGKRTKPWMTPAAREAIHKRNRLRHLVRTHRKQWLEACREAKNEIAKAKTEAWRGFLEDTISSPNEKRTWRLINCLNDTPEKNSPNEAMRYNGRLITSNEQKADIFSSHYATVSSLKMSKEDRAINWSLRKRLSALRRLPEEDRVDFTMVELQNAIGKMKSRGTP